MTRPALLFGSIGTIAETSDIQRRAYNRSLSEAGLDWSWDRDTYVRLLGLSGGRDRLSLLASATGTVLSDDDIAAIHARKTDLACAEITATPAVIRPGVADILSSARAEGRRTGFVTSTSSQNVDAVLAAGRFAREDFDVIVTRDDVSSGKPAPDAWLKALSVLDIEPTEAVAVEDTLDSVLSARRAGLSVVAFPGAYVEGQWFGLADAIAEGRDRDGARRLEPGDLDGLPERPATSL